MIAFNMERSLFAALVPPGPAHVHAVQCLALGSNAATALVAGFFAALPLDYLLRITGRADLQQGEVRAMPAPYLSHPLASVLQLRTLRLNCLTSAYAGLWKELFDPTWLDEKWAVNWTAARPLGDIGPGWRRTTPLRTECDRRAALVEIDALVAVWLGLGTDELLAMVCARYWTISEREDQMWFDSAGRKIAADSYTFGFRQTKEDWVAFQAYLDDPERNPVPEGYAAPFYKADRENEYRQAHAVFSKRLQDAIDGGWRPS